MQQTRQIGNTARLLLTVGLFNLTGLGLGYLYIKHWLSWLLHFLITVGLVVVAILVDASRMSLLWLGIFGLWLCWMVFEGVVEALRAKPVESGGTLIRQWVPAVFAFLILALEIVGLWGYPTLGQQEFTAGAVALRTGDCRVALQHLNRVTTIFELTLSPNIAKADEGISECSQFIAAEDAWKKGDYAEAISQYGNFVQRNPKSALVPSARDAIAKVYGDWAKKLRSAGDYQAAIDKYKMILSDYGDTSTSSETAQAIAETYGDWAAGLCKESKYEDALKKYQVVSTDFSATLLAKQIPNLAAQTYADWAMQLRKTGNHQLAVEKYKIILNQYSNTPTGAQTKVLAAETLSEWAAQLQKDKQYDDAVAKYQSIVKEYPDTPSAKQAASAASLIYGDWAAKLRSEGKFKDAIARYQDIIKNSTSAEEKQAATKNVSETYCEWGKQHLANREYVEAIEKYTLAKQGVSDPVTVAAAEKGYNDALTALSQDTGTQGKQAMNQALTEVSSGKPATSPAVGIAKNEPGKALLSGTAFTLPTDLVATKPGHLMYIVSVTAGNNSVGDCGEYYIYSSGSGKGQSVKARLQQSWWRIEVRATKTGGVAAERVFYGRNEGCSTTLSFCSMAGDTAYTCAAPPSSTDVISWLQTNMR